MGSAADLELDRYTLLVASASRSEGPTVASGALTVVQMMI